MAIPFEPGKYYHIYNRANNYENLFIEEMNYAYFLEKSRKYLDEIVEMYAYCLMPNHFHFVLRFRDEHQLPEKYRTGGRPLHLAFSNFFNSYAKSINKMYKRRGSLFQKHLPRRIIHSESYLRSSIVYTHLNPVHHGFVNTLESYPYSSYKSIMGEDECCLARDNVRDLFGGREAFLAAHHLTLEQPDPQGLE